MQDIRIMYEFMNVEGQARLLSRMEVRYISVEIIMNYMEQIFRAGF